MWMEYDPCTVTHGPANGLRVTPTFMADHDTKCYETDLKDPPVRTRGIKAFFGGIELDFVLETYDRSIAINHQGGRHQGVAHDPFGAKNNPDIRIPGRR